MLKVANLLQRSRQTVYNVYQFLKSGGNAKSYYKQYKKTKLNSEYLQLFHLMNNRNTFKKRVVQGWNPDVLISRAEFPISCSICTLFRMFKNQIFNSKHLPMKGKINWAKQAFRRSIHNRMSN